MNTYTYLWQCPAGNFLEWDTFQTKAVKKIETHILCSITFFRKSCPLWDKEEKYGTARQATDDNIVWRIRFACRINKSTDMHSEYVILVAFPRQQCLRERLSLLRYSHIVCALFVGHRESADCTEHQTVYTRWQQPSSAHAQSKWSVKPGSRLLLTSRLWTHEAMLPPLHNCSWRHT